MEAGLKPIHGTQVVTLGSATRVASESAWEAVYEHSGERSPLILLETNLRCTLSGIQVYINCSSRASDELEVYAV